MVSNSPILVFCDRMKGKIFFKMVFFFFQDFDF